MEPKNIALIDANLVRLVQETEPSTVFLSTLMLRGILGNADIDRLQSISSRHQKNHELYTILKTRNNSFINLVCALNSTNQTGVRDILYYGKGSVDKQFLTEGRITFVCPLDGCSATNSPNSDKILIRFHINSPSHHFTGRKEYLEHIQNIFSSCGTAAIICQTIVGLGGIGKTDLARKAVDQYIRRDDNKDLHVIWLNAETNEDLKSDFRTLAKDEKSLGVDVKDAAGGEKDIQTLVKEVYTYFKNTRCLFVFDNAENEKYLVGFLPSSHAYLFNSSMPMVLITSRDNAWSNNLNCSVVKLDLFSEDDAIRFVKKVLKLDDGCTNPSNQQFVKQLVCKLEYLPLAIKQAAFYIAEQMKVDINYGVKMYLEEWEQNCQKLLDKKILGEHKTTYTTWKTTIDKIAKDKHCGEVAVDVLKKLAFMTPDGIVLELFQFNHWMDLPYIREAFALLLRYSMISHAGSGFSIHRLVQEVTRIDMRLNGSEEHELEKALGMLTQKISSVNISKLQSAWQHAKRYRKLAIKYSDVPWRISRLLRSFKGLIFTMEFTKQELEFLKEALADQFHVSILKLEAEYYRIMRVLGRGYSGYDQLWKKVEKVLMAGSEFEGDLARLLSYFCYIDSEKRRYPEAWSGLDGILRSVDVSSCDEIWMDRFFDYGRCFFNAFDFSSSTVFFNKALNIIDRTQRKDTNFKQQLEHWLKLTSLYTCPSDNTQAIISELLHSLCRLLYSMNKDYDLKFGLAFETSYLLFYKFGVNDEALGICRYLLFVKTEAGGVSFDVPNTLMLMSVLLFEQGKFQEALACSLEANNLFKGMQHNKTTLSKMYYKIHLARALGGMGQEAESLTMIMKVLPELLSLECRDLNQITLIFMHLVAAELCINNQEKEFSQKLVNRAEKLLLMFPINLPMPFLRKRLCQIKEELGMKPTLDVKTERIENLGSVTSAVTKSCCFI